eukprot:SAG25_NODE_95_length_15927_cov_8.666224_3_plen_123_part_00
MVDGRHGQLLRCATVQDPAAAMPRWPGRSSLGLGKTAETHPTSVRPMRISNASEIHRQTDAVAAAHVAMYSKTAGQDESREAAASHAAPKPCPRQTTTLPMLFFILLSSCRLDTKYPCCKRY